MIPPGDSESASFNDDTSPHSRFTSNSKVSIEGQVIPGTQLDWYYRILQSCQSIVGEVKSTDAWNIFKTLDPPIRTSIWGDLSKVRVHVVDPRPYRENIDNFLRSAWNDVDAPKLLREQAFKGDSTAKNLLSRVNNVTADSIWKDSYGAKLQWITSNLRDDLRMVTRDEAQQLDSFVGIDQLKSKSPVRDAVSLSAKSAAVFHEPLDYYWEFGGYDPYSPKEMLRIKMESRLLKPHTFDKESDHRPVSLLEEVRSKILGNLETYEELRRKTPKSYLQTDSKSSFFLQAADIAAGFASKIWEESGFVAVVSSFEHVTYNGRRFSVRDAEDEIRRSHWRDVS